MYIPLAFITLCFGMAHVSAISRQAARNRLCSTPSIVNCASCFKRLCGSITQWGEWSDYGSCSATCGDGTMTRTRPCENSAVDATCPGDESESKPCNLGACIVDGNWSNWGAFSPCSETCGNNAYKTRRRKCNNPAPENGGMDCVGSDVEKIQCNVPCPIDGNWGPWRPFSVCTKVCGAGGTKTRDRLCNNPSPSGGKDCPGDASETIPCENRPCLINGEWGAWGAWSSCSVTCESATPGFKSRKRPCDNPVTSCGFPCVGTAYEIDQCTSNASCNTYKTISSPGYPNYYNGTGRLMFFDFTDAPPGTNKVELIIEDLDSECNCYLGCSPGSCSAECDACSSSVCIAQLTLQYTQLNGTTTKAAFCGHHVPNPNTFIGFVRGFKVIFTAYDASAFRGVSMKYKYI